MNSNKLPVCTPYHPSSWCSHCCKYSFPLLSVAASCMHVFPPCCFWCCNCCCSSAAASPPAAVTTLHTCALPHPPLMLMLQLQLQLCSCISCCRHWHLTYDCPLTTECLKFHYVAEAPSHWQARCEALMMTPWELEWVKVNKSGPRLFTMQWTSPSLSSSLLLQLMMQQRVSCCRHCHCTYVHPVSCWPLGLCMPLVPASLLFVTPYLWKV